MSGGDTGLSDGDAWPVALARMLRFGAVGGAATAVHAAAYLGWTYLGVGPLGSNILAFCIAAGVSFLGHFHWTFHDLRGTSRSGPGRLARFTLVALCGLGLNTMAVLVVVETLSLPQAYAAVPMLTVVPLILFLLSRFWAFA